MSWCERYRKSTKEKCLHLLPLVNWRNHFLWCSCGIALVPFASCWMMYLHVCEGFWNGLPYWHHFQALVFEGVFFFFPKIVFFKNAIVVLKLLPQGLKNYHLKANMSSLCEIESVDYCRAWCCVFNLPGVLFCQLSSLSPINLTCLHRLSLLPSSIENAQISLHLQKPKKKSFYLIHNPLRYCPHSSINSQEKNKTKHNTVKPSTVQSDGPQQGTKQILCPHGTSFWRGK